MPSLLDQLDALIGYRFKDPALAEAAVTHRSVGQVNNERLEYLGDATLGFVTAGWLFKRYPDASEGDLSRLRAALVRGEKLAEIANDLNLGELIRLGPGELKSGGHRRASILADAVEALIGAVYLESGIESATALLERLYEGRLEQLPPLDELKDSKTRLQEWLQGRKMELPEYLLTDVSGKAHAQTFSIECRVEELDKTTVGKGRSRRRAEQAAALLMLKELNDG